MGLKYLFGAGEAEIIQQIAYWRERPFKDYYLNLDVRTKKHEGRVFVRIPPRSLLDRWTGRLRHMSEKTFDRKVGSCKKQGLVITANLNSDARDTTNWYALVEEVMKPVTDRYEWFLERVISERRDHFEREGEPLIRLREEELWREFQAALREVRAEVTEIAASLGLGDGQGHSDPTPGTNNFLSSGPVMLTLRAESECLSAQGHSDPSDKDNLAPLLLYTENNVLLKTTTARIATPDGVVAAQSSLDNLPEPTRKTVARPKKATSLKPLVAVAPLAQPDDQTALPIVAAANKPKRLPDDVGRMTVELANRLLEVAADAMIEMSEAQAAALVGVWPQSSMSRAALVEAMNQIGVPRRAATEMVKSSEVACRWQLNCWERRPQSKGGYFKSEGGKADGNPIGAFRSTIASKDGEWAPWKGEEWIEELMASLRAQEQREKFEADKEAADAFFQGLSAPRRKRFIEDLLAERLRAKALYYEVGSDAWQRVRVSMLLDPKVRAEIEAWGIGAKTKAVAVEEPGAANGPGEMSAFDLARCDRYIARLKMDLEDDVIGLDELPGKVRTLGASKAMEQHIESAVRRLYEVKKAA